MEFIIIGIFVIMFYLVIHYKTELNIANYKVDYWRDKSLRLNKSIKS